MLSCLVSCFLSISVLSVRSAGGYGWGSLDMNTLWNLHPSLLLLAIFAFIPYGMLSYRLPTSDDLDRASQRQRHGVVQGVGLLCALGGYAAAYVYHELDGHVHLPPVHKALSKQVHIYGGLLALALLLAQGGLGVQLMLRSSKLPGVEASAALKARAGHSALGFRVWVGLVLISLLGLYMPLYEKARGNWLAPLLFSLIAAAFGVSVALVARALPATA